MNFTIFGIAGDLVKIWYLYRTHIILVTLVGLFVFRIISHSRSSREPIPASSLPSSPLLKPVTGNSAEKDVGDKSVKLAKSTGPRRVVGKVVKRKTDSNLGGPEHQKIQVLLFFSSWAGRTERTARTVLEQLRQTLGKDDESQKFGMLEPRLHDLSELDYDEFFVNPPKSSNATQDVRYFYLFLVPSYNIDCNLNTFLQHLQETHNDFRIDTSPLSSLLGYSVFGLGDREGWPTEEDGFCSQARDIDRWMAKLTARKRAFPLGMGDVKSDVVSRLEEWRTGVEDVLQDLARTGALGEGVVGSGDAVESDAEDVDSDDRDILPDDEIKVTRSFKSKDNQDDLEDIGTSMGIPRKENSQNVPIDFTIYGKKQVAVPETKEMVPKSSPTYTALTKQGYTIVGSHSGVKICRWTKSALRGRGSCYKFSFYGIASHQCMETTPSLSCSNKCVFCWRHGTNPVGTTWRWVVDPPDMIFNGVKEGHYKKIKMMRGVPGVRAERFAEAMRIRHCALSLVGEPIFYPHINEFTEMLHAEHISSFLVCNAQHPDQLKALKPVTQLYVSIDASNKESLKKIDRPLHRDFWERFQRCLEILREARFRQRTVFRLTLVKGFNIEDEVSGYADLVEKGLPCFVEVKGVTYCGTASSAGAGLTMQNVPFYEEVCTFVEALSAELQKRNLGYGIAAEHAHSCCILIASERFKLGGVWRTRIGYEKFFKCLESGEPFSPEDYMGDETPEWASWGNGGFDPRDERVHRKGKNKAGKVDLAGDGKLSEVIVEEEE